LDLNHVSDWGKPKYERLRDYLMAELTSGRFKPGDAIPSEQRLVEVLKVARNTVRHAISELARDGLVRRMPGNGTFVDAKARQRLNQGLDVFALITPETDTAYYLVKSRPLAVDPKRFGPIRGE